MHQNHPRITRHAVMDFRLILTDRDPHWNVATVTGKEPASSNLALFAKLSGQTANKVLRRLGLTLIEISPQCPIKAASGHETIFLRCLVPQDKKWCNRDYELGYRVIQMKLCVL